MKKITESDSNYDGLEQMSVSDLLKNINREDKTVAHSVEQQLSQIEKLINVIVPKMKKGGRLFYVGAGTSGRLGIIDASECPPTFGSSSELVQGIIAGGKPSLTKSSESLEDKTELSIASLKEKHFSNKDVLIGITSSGKTPYVISALNYSKSINALTISISSVPSNDSSLFSDIDIRLLTGPEILAGSTR